MMRTRSSRRQAAAPAFDLFQIAFDMRRSEAAVSRLQIAIAFDLAKSRIRIVHHIVSAKDAMLRMVYEVPAGPVNQATPIAGRPEYAGSPLEIKDNK